jgi:hypothetical protein
VRVTNTAQRTPGPWGPALLLLALTVLLTAQVFDPSLQLFDRDTGRFFYPFKQFIAARLRAGQLPLWFPWSSSGMSLLGEMSPGLFHPFTLLYLALPFELAFKLNHVLAVPLAGLGAFLLSRKLGAAHWAAALAGAVYAGSGYLASMSASNVYYALGAASVPLAIHGLLRFLEKPDAPRLSWAGFALALPLLGGEAQSALFAGYGGVLATLTLHGFRKLRFTALWGAVALLLATPVLFPGLAQLRRSIRSGGVSAIERESFAVSPLRLFGLALPWAFDDAPERTMPDGALPAYTEYFAGPTGSAFVTSIALSIPALLLAGFARGRKAALLAALALLFALGSTGGGFETVLRWLLPGLSLFRYAEKLVAPLSLLLALLAGLGATKAFNTPRAAGRLAIAALACAAILLAARFVLVHDEAPILRALQARGESRAAGSAQDFTSALAVSLLAQGCLAAALATIAIARWWKPMPQAQVLAAMVCAAAAVLAGRGLFFTAPVDLLHGPFAIAERLFRRAGPSGGAWRIDADPSRSSTVADIERRTSHALWTSQALAPHFNALAQVETAAVYGALPDSDYIDAWQTSPGAMTQLFGVRFLLRSPWALTEAEGHMDGFARAELGIWMREVPPQPRAFLVGCARSLPRAASLARLESADFDPHREALGLALPQCVRGLAGSVTLQRPSPEMMIAQADARRDSLLVFAEHFDPGWRATMDGKAAAVVEADLAALAVHVPPGEHEVRLRFWPVGLTAGLCCSLATILALLGFGLRLGRAAPQSLGARASPVM